ncbi:TraX family protein [Aerosakkonema sp. BLCC-F183]|uniref:TraX family protein n=1 Tax=Aerosakkonema sp. BLCC-F183 TaxID=3342834 RepID=UPI0035B71175
MTAFQIKVLAALLMLVDHIGAIFFPKIFVLRIVGRLSFPLFAWLIGQGEKHTKNFKLYLVRLIILGLISQPVSYLLFQW